MGIPSFPLGEVARNASRFPRGLEQECEASLCGVPSALKQGIQRGWFFIQLERSETSRKSFGFQHLRVHQVTKRSLAPFCHFFVAHVSIMN